MKAVAITLTENGELTIKQKGHTTLDVLASIGAIINSVYEDAPNGDARAEIHKALATMNDAIYMSAGSGMPLSDALDIVTGGVK